MRTEPLLNFVRKRLGLKNLVDYVQSRKKMLGLTNLPIRTVIDIGANKGRRARNYRRRFPEATIYCVEPIPELCRQLRQWAKTQAGKVEVLNLALSSAPSEATFYVRRDSLIHSTLLKPADDEALHFDEILVDIETLNLLAEKIDLAEDVLIKIDTEGLDLEIIRGGMQTLKRSAAVIIECTFYPTGYGDNSPVFEDILTALHELDYVYRGNIRCGIHNGTCYGADSLFVRREAARRIAA